MTLLKEFNFISVVFRLLLAMLAGGLIGYGRARKKRPTGLRTYMLTCTGAALAMLISLYEYEMIRGDWAEIVAVVGEKYDVARISAGVIPGIGFLAAGTIIAVAHGQVTGLTTATGLFAAVCMGMAAGAGFYPAVICGTLMILIIQENMTDLEVGYKRRIRNITLFVQMNSIDRLEDVSNVIRSLDAQVFDIDVERTVRKKNQYPSAVLTLKLSRCNFSHSGMLSSIAELPYVISVQEIIS